MLFTLQIDPSKLRIPDINDFISDIVLLHAKNKVVSFKVANSVVHVYKDEGRSPMNTLMSIPQKRQFLADVFGKF